MDGSVVLYKALGDDLVSGAEYGCRVEWDTQIVTCGDFTTDPICGGGLHLSPSPAEALQYREDATVILECEADLEAIVPIVDPDLPAKAKVAAARVVREVPRGEWDAL